MAMPAHGPRPDLYARASPDGCEDADVTDAEPDEQQPDDDPRPEAPASNTSPDDEKKSRWVGQAIADTISAILGSLR
jgi:hypothetical protein